ncbi:MAG: Nif3-like dinuclear metal center hexameric protein [Candidatus Micrarchaeota archaeon]
MLARDIIMYMEKVAPFNLAYPDDLIGLVFGNPDKVINHIGVSWAATDYVLEQAGLITRSRFNMTKPGLKRKRYGVGKQQAADEEEYVDMLVLHEYPFFEEISDVFAGLSFFEKPTNYKRLKTLISKDVCIYVAHSNLDETEGGTADILAKNIGLKTKGKLKRGRWGTISETTLTSLVSNLKTTYGIDVIKVVGDPESTKKFDIIGCYVGSGLGSIDILEEFYLKGCRALISTGLTEQVARYASELGIVLIDLERAKLERPVMQNLAEKMQIELKNVVVTLYECEDSIVYM